jgi:hypothetical protein
MGAILIHPIFGFDTSKKSTNVTAQDRWNLYCEVRNEKDRANMVLFRTASLTSFVNVGASPFRGIHHVGSLIYAVAYGTFYEINNAGVATSRGTLNTTSGRVCIEDNGVQVLVVDGVSGYTYTIATTTFAQIADPDFPNGATTCAFQAGFFIVEDPANNGRFVKSASYDGTSWPGDFATAESSPDPLTRVFVNQGVIHLLGAETTEFWGNTGALDFPWSPIQGSTIEWGLVAKWSVAKLGGQVTFVSSNTEGQVQVIRLSGYQPQIISTPELHTELDSYQSPSDATAFTYEFGGHEFYQVNFNTAGKSWLYDLTTSQQAGVPVWSRLTSGNTGGRHVGEMAELFLNQTVVTDYSTGTLYHMPEDEVSSDLWKIRSKHIFKDNSMLSVGRLWMDFETGVGLSTGQGSNPQVCMRYSKDGGHTWSSEVWRSLGAIGKYLTRVFWNRLGRARDWVFEISGSDPVKIVILNAGLNIKAGRE